VSAFTVYPAVDLRGGRVVRLQQGDPARLTAYSDDPGDTAVRWLQSGAGWLHVVNLDGAFGEGDDANRRALASILEAAHGRAAHVQFGGGLRSLAAIDAALRSGVSRVVLGTLAVEDPVLLADALSRYGPERIAVGIDARDGLVRVRGWQTDSGVPALDLARRMRALGLRTAIFTDVARDGLGSGLNLASTRTLAEATGLEVIASGGVRTLEDVLEAQAAGLTGVIVGRALYEGTLDLETALKEARHAGEADHSVS
jgi:phosphoribosylformimino-5-aminoimidazole carboxamide ribotide isomerase